GPSGWRIRSRASSAACPPSRRRIGCDRSTLPRGAGALSASLAAPIHGLSRTSLVVALETRRDRPSAETSPSADRAGYHRAPGWGRRGGPVGRTEDEARGRVARLLRGPGVREAAARCAR